VHGALGVVWGKSRAGDSVHLLLGHLLDTAAVGELVWDRFLSPAVRDRCDADTDGRGRLFFSLLCGLHDVGKATPAFQMKDEALAAGVRAAGLDWRALSPEQGHQWHHTYGDESWRVAQAAFVARVAADLGTDLAAFQTLSRPRRAGQLTLSSLTIMADWIASDETHFRGQANLETISLEGARERARTAWAKLGLRGGWRPGAPAPRGERDLVRFRFERKARETQAKAVAVAEEMPAPGLMIIEAPMGEGKTEAALVAAEVLARRFGADGVFVGMPTQATSDPMFGRVRRWLGSIDREVPIGLLPGRARFDNK